MAFKNIIVQQNGGGGGGGSGGFVDDFSLEIKGDEVNAQQQENVSFEIEANYDDSVAQQQEQVNFGFEGFADSNVVPTDARQSSSRRFATQTRTGGTNPANATGEEDGSTAQVKAGGLLGGLEVMDVVIQPPIDDSEVNPIAKAFYRVNGGLLDGASAGIFHFVETVAGNDAPVTPFDFMRNEGTTNAETGTTPPNSIANDDFYIGAVTTISDVNQFGTFQTSGSYSLGTTGSVSNIRSAPITNTSVNATDSGTNVDNFSGGLGGKGTAGLTVNAAAGIFIRGGASITSTQSTTGTISGSPNTVNFPSISTSADNSLVVYIACVGGDNPTNGNPTSTTLGSGIVGRLSHSVSGGTQQLASIVIGTRFVATAGNAGTADFTVTDGSGAGYVALAFAISPALADGNPALALADLPSSGNFLTSPAQVQLNNLATNGEIVFRFQHAALIPLLGGSVDVDAVSIDSTGVI